MTYVIGDIHGELDKLVNLLKIIQENYTSKLIFIGDYIDKGYYTKEVIDYLLMLSKQVECVFLRGNHEYMFDRALKGNQKAMNFFQKYGGESTLKSYLKDKYTGKFSHDFSGLEQVISPTHLAFIHNTIPCYETDNYLVVHAGVNPQDFCLNENNEDIYFIRYDFINYTDKIIDKRIIYGHTASIEPYFDKYKIGIDTGAAYPEYGHLSAYCLEEGFTINELAQIYRDPFFKKENS